MNNSIQRYIAEDRSRHSGRTAFHSLLQYIENALRLYDWSTEIEFKRIGLRWEVYTIETLKLSDIVNDVDDDSDDLVVVVTLYQGTDKDSGDIRTAYAIFDNDGSFMGFKNTSKYSDSLNQFCDTLFSKDTK